MAASKEDMTRLLNMARAQLAGASEDALKATLWEVFFEFYDQSSSWLEDIQFAVTATSNNQPPVLDYAVTPNEGRVVRLGGVVDANGSPQPALMPVAGTIHLVNAPNQAQGQLIFTATVVKNVSLPTDNTFLPVVSEDTLQLYPLALIDGLLGKMKIQPNRPYTDLKDGALKLASFQQGWITAKVDTFHRKTLGAQSWVYPQTFASNSQRGGISVPGDRGFA